MNSPSAARVGVVGAGYVGLTTAAASPTSATTWCVPTSCPSASPGSSAVRSRSSRPASPSWWRRGRRRAGSRSWSVPSAAAVDADFVFLCVRDPAGPRRRRRPPVPRGRQRPDRPGAAPGCPRRQQVDGAGGLGARRRRRAATRRRRRGVEPGVPARGHGGARLPAPRPSGHRRRPARRRRTSRRLVRRARRAGHHHRPGLGRDDQVRRQRVPGDEALVRQRHRRDVRVGRRPRRRRDRGHRAATAASARRSCGPARAGAEAASPRTRGRSSRSPPITATTSR